MCIFIYVYSIALKKSRALRNIEILKQGVKILVQSTLTMDKVIHSQVAKVVSSWWWIKVVIYTEIKIQKTS